MKSGVLGEMMLTFFRGKGGSGVVIDGCIRDWPHAQTLDLGFWIKGVTPNFHTQTDIMPFGVNVPIACGGVLVMPGDIIVADDDGAVGVPVALAPAVIEQVHVRHEWEDFAREMLSQGDDLRRYYPLTEDARPHLHAASACRPPIRPADPRHLRIVSLELRRTSNPAAPIVIIKLPAEKALDRD
jgi:regulator of RNase E activity RraA